MRRQFLVTFAFCKFDLCIWSDSIQNIESNNSYEVGRIENLLFESLSHFFNPSEDVQFFACMLKHNFLVVI